MKEFYETNYEITVKKWENSIKLDLNWDASMEQWFDYFMLILRRVSFVNPEEDIVMVDSEKFEEIVEERVKENLEDNQIEDEST